MNSIVDKYHREPHKVSVCLEYIKYIKDNFGDLTARELRILLEYIPPALKYQEFKTSLVERAVYKLLEKVDGDTIIDELSDGRNSLSVCAVKLLSLYHSVKEQHSLLNKFVLAYARLMVSLRSFGETSELKNFSPHGKEVMYLLNAVNHIQEGGSNYLYAVSEAKALADYMLNEVLKFVTGLNLSKQVYAEVILEEFINNE